MKSVLIVSENSRLLADLASFLPEEYNIISATDEDRCVKMLIRQKYDVVFTDIGFLYNDKPFSGVKKYKESLKRFWKYMPSSSSLIVISPSDNIREAVYAVKAGASNYVTYPFNAEELKLIINEVLDSMQMQLEIDYLRDQFWNEDVLNTIQTKSEKMRAVYSQVKSVAATKTSVLITGETGTGKGVLARLIHSHSSRKDGPFISLHCGAVAETLLESELFGHEKGSFTGAVRRKPGKFEIAQGGTIFLDEIGTISPAMQIKLLQVLQEKQFSRVGGDELIEADVRIIAATNEDLNEKRLIGEFRHDLFYRLNVFPIELPSLSERHEDIPLITEEILHRLNKHYGKKIDEVHPHVYSAFRDYEWPGNIRELENLLERAYIIETAHMLTPESFPQEIFSKTDVMTTTAVDITLPIASVRRMAVETVERQYLKELLSHYHGKINDTANAAGITTRQLNKLMTRYSLKKEDFKTRQNQN